MRTWNALVLFVLMVLCFKARAFSDVKELSSETYQVVLRNLNPKVGSWHILEVNELKTKKRWSFHLELPADQKKYLDLYPDGIIVGDKPCPLWNAVGFNLLKADFKKYPDPYFPVCEDQVFVRLKKPSTTIVSSTESVTKLLRNNIPMGEGVINLMKPYLVALRAEPGKDAFHSRNGQEGSPGPATARVGYEPDRVPSAAKHKLGIAIQQASSDLSYGAWYPARMHPGIFVSLMVPKWIAPDIKSSFPERVHPLSGDEADKLVYLVAYDLDLYQADFVVGLQEPKVSKEQTLPQGLVAVGNVPAYRRKDTVGVFVGGFKQMHGMIKWGPHQGKRYGFVQNGVTLEPLSQDLATFISTPSGLDLISWNGSEELKSTVVSARQNGLPLIVNREPHPFVSNWGFGNWSGNAEGRLRSLRSAICIQNLGSKRYLIFAAFSSATPSSMAKTLQAYQCETAMHLDMNAYMYLHNTLIDYKSPDDVKVEYLHQEMEYPKGVQQHRFILDNNERDFFYVYRRKSP